MKRACKCPEFTSNYLQFKMVSSFIVDEYQGHEFKLANNVSMMYAFLSHLNIEFEILFQYKILGTIK